MSFASGSPVVWPVPPDWRNPVRESLAWLTDVLQAPATGVTQHRSLRQAPRRTFTFDVVAAGQERRVADALIADRGGRSDWALPIWPDVQYLAAPLSSGATTIPCDPAYRDFVGGGRALLWRSLRQWELVTIDEVGEDGLELASATTQAWPAGTRLYPVRRARLADGPEETLWTDLSGRRTLTFLVQEACDWPAQLPATEYLGHPVLEHVSDAGENGSLSYARILTDEDNDVGLPATFDLAGRAFRAQSHRWRLWGAAERAAFRSLLYGLRGRQVPLWVPSGLQDLKATASIGSSSTWLTVEWAGYTLYGRQQPNRRDVRIVLHDGTAFIRRITGSAESGANEVLQLSSALGQTVAPGAIRRIEFLTLCTLASDEVVIEHHADLAGAARASTPFTAVVPDV